jgi:hypothetical protein
VAPKPTGLSDLGHVDLRTRLYECGEYVWVEGALPGAVVNLCDGPAVLGSGPADEGVATFRLSVPIPAPRWLRCFQSVPGLGPGPDAMCPAEALPVPARSRLPAPAVAPDVRGCDRAIQLTGMIDGATVTVERRSGPVDVRGTFTDSNAFELSEPLIEGDEIVVRQNVAAACRRRAEDSGPVRVGPLEPVTAPQIDRPLCAGTTVVRVQGLRSGATVHLTADGTQYDGAAPADRDWLDCRIPPLAGGPVTATQELCGVLSDPCVPVEVDPREGFPPRPALLGPLYGCARSVSVVDIHPGAVIQVFARSLHGDGPISDQVHVRHTNAVVDVQPVLRRDDDVFVVQWACSDIGQRSAVEPVVAPPGTGPVDVLGILFDGDDEVGVRGALPGGEVKVYATDTFLGQARTDALHPVVAVRTTRPLVAGETVVARQTYCGTTSDDGLPERVDRAPTSGPRPFYIVGHNPNSFTEAFTALGDGANALEPDVQVFEDHRDQLCISHERGDDAAHPLVDYLDYLHACVPQLVDQLVHEKWV